MWVTELERETEKDRDTEATVDGPVNSGYIRVNSYD